MKKNKKNYSVRLKERFPDFDREWSKFVNQFGVELVNIIKDKVNAEYSYLKDLSQFKFKIVIDNNFVFGQIRGAIRKRESLENSFLHKLLTAKSIEMFAPYMLREELLEKVQTLLKEDERELGMSYALTFLSKIKIQDAQWTNEWKRANNLIGEHDPDDVSYLALALDVGGHSILSQDKIFQIQGDVHVWEHKEMGRVVANYNSGFISLVLIDKAGELLWKIIALIFKFVRDLLLGIVELLSNLAVGVINGMAKLHPAVIASLVTLGIIYMDDLKKYGGDFFKYLIQKGREIWIKVVTALKEIVELLQTAINTIQMGTTVAFEFLGFLLNEYTLMYNQVKDLKIEFPLDSLPDPEVFQPKIQEVPLTDTHHEIRLGMTGEDTQFHR